MMPENPYEGTDQPNEKPKEQQMKEEVEATTSVPTALLHELVCRFMGAGKPIPLTLKTPTPSEEEIDLQHKINRRLIGQIDMAFAQDHNKRCIRPISVAFPPSSDVLLALIKTRDVDEITGFFNDYFMFCDHSTLIVRCESELDDALDRDLLNCTKKWFLSIEPSKCVEPEPTQQMTASAQAVQASQCPTAGVTGTQATSYSDPCKDPCNYVEIRPPRWPTQWCLPAFCVTLAGKRHLYTPSNQPAPGRVRRLFIGDLVWLFFMEKMGIFQILGVILDDYAMKGKIPISNGVIDEGLRDDIIALVLESMVRETKCGLSSTVRDRDCTYRRCLGWTSDAGRKLGPDCVVNTAFSNLFHRFIQNALEFYKDKRLASAIQGAGLQSKPSVATLLTLSDTLELLKKSFDPFDYGRNYYNTLSGIVWSVAGMSLIRDLRTTLGIPTAYNNPYEFIPAAYDILVMQRPITPKETNRYLLCRECANDARDILLDIEILNHQQNSPGGELDIWLSVIESKVEGYRTAYRGLTGVDLGMEPPRGVPNIEQQV
jgi:hypothetical protein